MNGKLTHKAGSRSLLETLEPRLLLDGQAATAQLLNASPALFVANQGQWADSAIRYAFQGAGASVLFTDNGPVFQGFREELAIADCGLRTTPPIGNPQSEIRNPRSNAEPVWFSVNFLGANTVRPRGMERSETSINYLVGGASNWHTDVPAYELVSYPGLYDGIDLQTWGRRDGLKYEFHVAPGADYRQIQVRYEGVEGLSLDAAGALHVQTPLGELVDGAPVIYQEFDGRRVPVAGAFELVDATTYTFALSGDYDTSRPLVIDPDLAWLTYLGGNEYDYASGIAVDGAGNAYVTGGTRSPGLATPGAYDTTFGGGSYYGDAFIAKLDPTGSSLAYFTYLGGNNDDVGADIAVDGAGNAYVTGGTYSSGLATPGAYDTTYGGASYEDAFIAEVSLTGSSLVYFTYLGGSQWDGGASIAVDGAGNAYVTGYTKSSALATPGAYDTTYGGGLYDAFVAKISPTGSSLAYLTYLGGAGEDYGRGIAVDGSGNAYVTGYTESSGLATPGAYDTTLDGGYDAFIAKINPTGSNLLYFTYLDGGVGGIAVDGAGNAYVTGGTSSSGLATPGAYDTTLDGGSDAFVAKLSPTGSSLAYLTYLGGSGNDYAGDIAVDGTGNAYVTGYTDSSGLATPGAYDTTSGGLYDAFIAKISPTGGSLAYFTYLGGTGDDSGHSIALDGAGNVYLTGYTNSSGLPTPGAYDTTYGDGGADAFIAKFSGLATEVKGRHVFYNHSALDGDDPAATAGDDAAIAADKVALLPGGTSAPGNLTSYSRGINGIMVDIAVLGNPAGLTLENIGDYFTFKAGPGSDPGGWGAAPAPSGILVRPCAGTGGSDRITLVWPDEAIANTWLEVTVLAANIGLAGPDTFYFGNLVGDITGDGAVLFADYQKLEVGFGNPGGINDGDLNCDGWVLFADYQKLEVNFGALLAAPTFAKQTGLVEPPVVPSAQTSPALAESISLAAKAAGAGVDPVDPAIARPGPLAPWAILPKAAGPAPLPGAGGQDTPATVTGPGYDADATRPDLAGGTRSGQHGHLRLHRQAENSRQPRRLPPGGAEDVLLGIPAALVVDLRA